MFALAPPGRIEALLRGAGFTEIVVEAVDLEIAYEDLDAYLTVSTDCSRPFVDALEAMDEAQRAEVSAALGDAMAPFRQDDGGYRVPARSLVAAASA
jgi:hypothetical protein